MVTWEQFEKWLRNHRLPTDTVMRIELVSTTGGVCLQAECLTLNDVGKPIVRPNGQALTETLVRRLVYLPGEQPPDTDDE